MAKLFDFQWQISVPESLLQGGRFDRWEEVSLYMVTVAVSVFFSLQGGTKNRAIRPHI